MSSAPSTSFNPVKIALTATGVLAAATVGYAVYFDYRRRNDPVFRKKLLKEHKKVDKKVKHQQESGKAQIQTALRRAIQIANAEPVPETAEGKEQFFMEQVALGEQLAARSPEFYVASAISFYKALKVYPAPQELIMIYQKTQPPAVFDLVMELISMEINEAASSRGASSSSSGGPPRSSDPILQELEEGEQGENQAEKSVEQEEEIQVNKGPSSTASTEGDDLSNVSPPSGSGSFVHVETDTKEGEAVKAEVGVNAQDPPEEPLA